MLVISKIVIWLQTLNTFLCFCCYWKLYQHAERTTGRKEDSNKNSTSSYTCVLWGIQWLGMVNSGMFDFLYGAQFHFNSPTFNLHFIGRITRNGDPAFYRRHSHLSWPAGLFAKDYFNGDNGGRVGKFLENFKSICKLFSFLSINETHPNDGLTFSLVRPSDQRVEYEEDSRSLFVNMIIFRTEAYQLSSTLFEAVPLAHISHKYW